MDGTFECIKAYMFTFGTKIYVVFWNGESYGMTFHVLL